jgi:hypothetical protein
MARQTKNPIVILALSPAATATALDITPERVREAIASGALIVRCIGPKRRIAVFGEGGIHAWFESWPVALSRQRKT